MGYWTVTYPWTVLDRAGHMAFAFTDTYPVWKNRDAAEHWGASHNVRAVPVPFTGTF